MLSGGVKSVSDAASLGCLARSARDMAASVLALGAEAADAMEANAHAVSPADVHALIAHVESATSGLMPFAHTVVPCGQSVPELSEGLAALQARLNSFLS